MADEPKNAETLDPRVPKRDCPTCGVTHIGGWAASAEAITSERMDGGPAFPHLDATCQRINESEHYEGLTVRDYFAAHAPAQPQGWVGTAELHERLTRPDGMIFAEVEWRWHYADMMVAQRTKATQA